MSVSKMVYILHVQEIFISFNLDFRNKQEDIVLINVTKPGHYERRHTSILTQVTGYNG